MSFDGEAIAALAIFIVGLAIAERRKLKTKKRQKKVYLHEIMATQTRKSRSIWYSSLRTEVRRWREIQKISKNDPRKLWRVIGAYRSRQSL